MSDFEDEPSEDEEMINRILREQEEEENSIVQEEEYPEEDLFAPSSPATFHPTTDGHYSEGNNRGNGQNERNPGSPTSNFFTDHNDEDEDEDLMAPSSPGIYDHFQSQSQSQSQAFSQNSIESQQQNGIGRGGNAAKPQKVAVVGGQELIWGTTINTADCKASFRKFLNEFKRKDANGREELLSVYNEALSKMRSKKKYVLEVDCEHLAEFDAPFYEKLVAYPSEIFSIVEDELSEICKELWPDLVEEAESGGDPFPAVQFRPFNLLQATPMRQLNPEDIDKLVSIKGMIIRTSSIIPDMKRAWFSCLVCSNGMEISLHSGRFTEPKSCNNCNGKNCLALVHNRCVFTDKQWIKLQETPDSIPEGETPHTVSMYSYNDLVDVPRPGDRIVVTGIFRATPMRKLAFQRSLKSIYKTSLDVVHIKRESSRMEEEREHEEEEVRDKNQLKKDEKVKEMSKQKDIYTKLMNSLAPSIWELEDVKKGILLQLFGGTHKSFEETGIGRFRGEINVLMCGDPGTSKSQILQYVHKIAPRGIYTSGKGSSAVGLTAYIAKDPETRETILESGALVLSDRGVCCIDEFDKMSDQTRSILHEAMEQQTVSIAKAGIICTLNARTSILASANPRESRYNPKLSVVDNIQLPPTLLSRFDLIYLMLDKPSERSDRKLASHIVSLYFRDEQRVDNRERIIPSDLLMHYISYAKRYVHPKISEECVDDLVKSYTDMRKLGGNKKTITATPRQLESMIRLSEAHAKMRLSDVVEKQDVAEAARLIRSALQQAAMDPTTGTIDMDLITTGHSATFRSRLAVLTKELRNLINSKVSPNATIKFDVLFKSMSEQSAVEIPQNEFKDALRSLVEEEVISMSQERNATIRRLI
eukprot:TRINITY_DN6057_c0_g2_i1.p1 TRINITY_DN6057_c0_g2~~TRINITY_DN6057_c0_g2_i1.p1  ORF type:complete len:873 (+),score=313.57 TRINITY_DN6057_c0_g2_i1:103-2721(+)